MIIKTINMNFNILKLLLGILLVMIFVACDEKKEQEENHQTVKYATKAIDFENTGVDFLDEKLVELSVICANAEDIDNMQELLIYQEKNYGENLSKFEEANKDKIKKLSKEKKQKYNAAQEVFHNYFFELMKIAQANDEKKRKKEEKRVQDSLEQVKAGNAPIVEEE